ncbi:phosphatidylethanolamine-binding protein [Durotheca rogersii]|uniref:phosphatidylethanolamine-binding protein n=1 Tax=Durotheca rogersii TaxID=419775 RepID=UPI00221FD489|nr:phosphatidylethanolamine-binding protein [Durotheca rogersii]KAI5865904.1 phosphatidylethanolamine-binding protein [Durotheca rogersii]
MAEPSLLPSLAAAGLVPGAGLLADLIPATFAPTTRLDVVFASPPSGEAAAVDLGATLFRSRQCARPPRVSFAPEGGDPGPATYLLVMADPDAPTPDDPKFAFWRHYVVRGLRAAAAAAVDDDDDDETQVLTEYLGPGPKEDSKPHCYLSLLYREPPGGLRGLARADVGGDAFVERRSFAPAAFAARHGLVLVAANWMRCAADRWTE